MSSISVLNMYMRLLFLSSAFHARTNNYFLQTCYVFFSTNIFLVCIPLEVPFYVVAEEGIYNYK